MECFVGDGKWKHGYLLSMRSITTKEDVNDCFHSRPLLLWEERLLILKKNVYCCQPTADTEGDHKNHKIIDDDTLCVGFARLAVVLCIATLAFDMAHHFGSDRAAPPGVLNGLRVGLSAVGAGGILSWILHKKFSGEICFQHHRGSSSFSKSCLGNRLNVDKVPSLFSFSLMR